MDDIVRQAMAKWPHVPDCYGWLGLNRRGNWYMRDDKAQAAGSFTSGKPGAKGSLLQHKKLIEFIQRNYLADVQGRWYFQNGPQRVFVELEVSPLIWRVSPDFSVQAHTEEPVRVHECLVDELGQLYLVTDRGFGLVHTQDMVQAAEAVVAGVWLPLEVKAQSLPTRFGYVPSPQALLKSSDLKLVV